MVRIAATIGVVCISFSAVLVRAADVSPSTAAVFRTTYAVPFLLALWLARRDLDRRTGRSRLVAVAAGLLLAVDLTVWHHSIEYIGAGLATVLANAQVVFVGLAAWIVWHERPARSTFWTVPIIVAGLVLVSGLGRPDAYGTNPALGVVLGVATGIAYSGFLIVFRSATQREETPAAGPLLDATVGAAVGSLLLGVAFGPVSFTPTWPAHGWLVLLAVVAQVAGWLLITTALPRVPALETSVLLLIQPVAAMVWGRVFFAETVSWVQGVGVVVVILGVVIVSARGAATRSVDAGAVPARRIA
jgi:drug/metabolite transporter (DMT)-like permease